MPYITQEQRLKYAIVEDELDLAIDEDTTVGDLNYLLTLVMKEYLNKKGLRYATLNDIRGAIENAASEFYRRVAIPYEDEKIAGNGDVY